MVEITLTIMLQIVQTVGILVGIIYYITIMRNANRTRQTELLFQRHKVDFDYLRSWADVILIQDWKDFEELEERYPWNTHFEERTRVLYILNTYNNLGLILREKVTDPNLLFELYTPSNVITTWKKYEEVLRSFRTMSNDPAQYCGFEFLYNEAKKLYPNVDTFPTAKIESR
jgi:hypothetical protein